MEECNGQTERWRKRWDKMRKAKRGRKIKDGLLEEDERSRRKRLKLTQQNRSDW